MPKFCRVKKIELKFCQKKFQLPRFLFPLGLNFQLPQFLFPLGLKENGPFPKNVVLFARSSAGNRNKIASSFGEEGNKFNRI